MASMRKPPVRLIVDIAGLTSSRTECYSAAAGNPSPGSTGISVPKERNQ